MALDNCYLANLTNKSVLNTEIMNINPVILSIPIYFGLIVIEWTYDLIKKKGIYRLSDAFGNISCGLFEQITGVFLKILSIGIYVFIYENFMFRLYLKQDGL